MYISRLRLRNIRCFEEVDLDLTSENIGPPRKFATIVGDNGVGKTTLLRSLAIGLCEEAGAYSLLSSLWGDFVGDPKEDSSIEIDVWHQGKQFTLRTELSTSKSKDYQIKQLPEQIEAFPFKSCFICAYGAGRGVQGTFDYNEFAVVDAVYSLFDYDQALQNPELAMRRWAGFDKKRADDVCRWLEHVLLLDEDSVELDDTGIYVNEKQLRTIGDGYQATIVWILDMLSWAKLAKKEKRGNKFTGIVIIDELEQHLHPTWQRELILKLREQFPNVQFITSTHSPLCAAGIADLDDGHGYLGRVFEENGVMMCEELSPMEGWRYDKVLTSPAFGASGSRNVKIEELRRELHKLYSHKRNTKVQKDRIDEITRELEKRMPVIVEKMSLEDQEEPIPE
jgi:GTPase SAR1 family protein